MAEEIKVCIIIPALEPNGNLITLLDELRSHLEAPGNSHISAQILLVDDGSGPAYGPVFLQAEAYGCILLRHAVNLGKGRALKTAFNHYLNEFPDYHGVVTVDSDGQHKAADIIRCIGGLSSRPSPDSGADHPAQSGAAAQMLLVLGCRDFNDEAVPFKSRYGNKLTRSIFRFFSGVSVSDTQTGLRVLPTELIKPMLTVPGERFEYEMNMLIECGNRNIAIKEIPIETVYLENNAGSHFNPLLDSVKIYATFLKYIASSLSASLLDFIIFVIATGVGAGLEIAMTVSRAGSATFNFTVNRNLVFKSKSNIFATALKYLLLVVISGVLSYYIILFLNQYISVYLAKVAAETLVFVVNYYVQKRAVFSRG